jgi:hypothetical protein
MAERLDHDVKLDFEKRETAGKAGTSNLRTYRHYQHRHGHRPPPRRVVNCDCEKPMADAAVSFVGLLSKSFALRLAGADQPTAEQIMKPDVEDFKAKALAALLAALFCPNERRN